MAKLIEKTVIHVVPVSWYAGGIYRTAAEFQEIVTENEYEIELTDSTYKKDQGNFNPSIMDMIEMFRVDIDLDALRVNGVNRLKQKEAR